MRWILTWLAAVCLLAAATARPDDPRTRDPRATHLDPGAATPVLVARRDAGRVDLRDRLSPFVVPIAPALARPPRAVASAPAASVSAVLDREPPTPSARGPPHD